METIEIGKEMSCQKDRIERLETAMECPTSGYLLKIYSQL